MDFSDVKNSLHIELFREHREHPPRLLCHYTTAEGLIGILESGEIWLTHIAYLNDSFEFEHATRYLRGACSWIKDGGALTDRQERFVEHLNARIEGRDNPGNQGLIGPSAFVACFSLLDDSLSQWRAYGSSQGGFCLCFDPQKIWDEKNRNEAKDELWLLPCEYDTKRATELAVKALTEALVVVEQSKGEPDVAVEQFIANVSWAACAVKHPGFREEREWRIVRFAQTLRPDELALRPNAMLAPYCRFSFGSQKSLIGCLRKIVVGPQRHAQHAAASLRMRLERNYPFAVPVHLSEVPYRTV